MKKNIIVFSVFGLLAIACKPKLEAPNVDAGSLKAERFVIIGGTSTAGYADGALYFEAQENSVASILAQQFKTVGGGSFSIPFVDENSVGLGVNGKSRTYLGYKTDCLGNSSLSPLPKASSGDASILNSMYASKGPFQMLSVPELKIEDVTNSNYASINPFFNRISSSSNASILSDALARNPTFYALSLGEQDVLEYSLSGGTSDAPISSISFNTQLNTIVQQLKNAGAQGSISTIPDVTTFPFFTTIPYNGLTLDEEQAEQLNVVFNPIDIYFQVGNNPFVIADPDAGAFGVRMMEEGEMVLLSIPLDSVRCHKWGSLVAIPNKYVITKTEATLIRNTISAYNQVIQNVAQQNSLALVELHAFYQKVHKGFTYNGVNVNSRFVSGGAFSLDGVQLNPLGNALVANEYINAINKHFKSTIPQVNALKYRGVKFP